MTDNYNRTSSHNKQQINVLFFTLHLIFNYVMIHRMHRLYFCDLFGVGHSAYTLSNNLLSLWIISLARKVRKFKHHLSGAGFNKRKKKQMFWNEMKKKKKKCKRFSIIGETFIWNFILNAINWTVCRFLFRQIQFGQYLLLFFDNFEIFFFD